MYFADVAPMTAPKAFDEFGWSGIWTACSRGAAAFEATLETLFSFEAPSRMLSSCISRGTLCPFKSPCDELDPWITGWHAAAEPSIGRGGCGLLAACSVWLALLIAAVLQEGLT
mmetsp:Transcript_15639/g.31437  ORF Transcript_15639/g.31437 Transcript_15639/m.31437 type:complete len:114 (+) Transcript_15639:1068-1409(+)